MTDYVFTNVGCVALHISTDYNSCYVNIHHMHAMLDHKSTSVVTYDWLRLQSLQQIITVGAIQ